jgi:hypothetical protein
MTPDRIDQFDAWCWSSILHEDLTSLSRRFSGNWGFARRNVPGWPQVVLHRTDMRDQYALPWEALGCRKGVVTAGEALTNHATLGIAEIFWTPIQSGTQPVPHNRQPSNFSTRCRS